MQTTASATALCLLVATAAAMPQEPGSSAGHNRTKALAELGKLPTALEVNVSDLIDFPEHRLAPPRAGEDIGLEVRLEATGYGTWLMQVGFITAPSGDRTDTPPVHLALVLDCSGSMHAAGKMDRLKEALRTFVKRLRPDDAITLVTYSNSATVHTRRREVRNGAWLRDAIDELQPGGSTNLHGGLMAGLDELAEDADPKRSRRAILLTDGIANVGETDPSRILADALARTRQGIDLSTVGLGVELNTQLLDQLARGSRGLFHFVADAADIDQAFRRESDALLCPVARQVQLSVELPAGLVVDHVFGYEVEASPGGFRLPLTDLNRGVSGLVLARLRARHAGEDTPPFRVAARLDYRRPDGSRGAAEAEQRGSARDDSAQDGAGRRLADPELRKNYTIAVLAQGMHDMARAAEQRRWVDASRDLDRAMQTARRQFPDADDADVRRVFEMAQGFERTLRQHVDRFRDY